MRNPLKDDPLYRRFFDLPELQQRDRKTQPAGSGVIVNARQGYVVTNNHIVNLADEITVTLSDGRLLPATRCGIDPQLDLALLRVNAGNLPEIAFADSGALRVGDFVVALGNPLGLDRTVSFGIVTLLGRGGLATRGYEDFVQTNASIDPGNSGGALVDLRGDLVGISTATPASADVRVGSALPSNIVSAIVAQLIKHGEVHHAKIGVRVQALSAALAKSFNVSLEEGALVVEVDKHSAAAKAGIVPGDVIVRFDDVAIRRVVEFHERSALGMLGDTVTLTVSRDGKPKNLAFGAAAGYP